MGLGKISTKKCAQSHVSSLWRLSQVLFLMGLGKIFTKKCAQSHVSSLWRLTWVFDETWKVSTKKVWPVTRFFAVETNLGFWWDLEKFSQKKCAQSQVSSLWRLTWVFDATWKVWTKKVWPVTRFFAVETNLSFWRDLEKFSQKVCPVTRFFAVETILSFWEDLESFDKKCAQSQVSSMWRLS